MELEEEKNYTSVAVILGAIIAARFGLWLFDLTNVQIFQVRRFIIAGFFLILFYESRTGTCC